MRFPDHITMTAAENGAVLLNGRTGRYFQINATAHLVLTALLDGATPAEAAEHLAETYPGAADRAQADTTDLITRLTIIGLLIP
ncbi:lasso peptide biosynthesis PqqD family chaperone [Nonomuraea basaltis]|uniref:lasso peptide biosynthesis PqqD family chaperone n=1 Tax=Nonomuraea basaltis TaxID=2495887 RepID=UPI00110C6096|nr:lasso peptide biosynthesis PqqD family chaperone [Nonomuraea basaltis]TMR99099.1 lasso peptide biosynthesis PqqD family chaperone [Nonomuraea basaltis]